VSHLRADMHNLKVRTQQVKIRWQLWEAGWGKPGRAEALIKRHRVSLMPEK
jgi:hypothetical protein